MHQGSSSERDKSAFDQSLAYSESDLANKHKKLSAYEHHDMEYFAKLEIGNPPQPLYVAIDTQSPLLWVTSSRCKSIACQIHNKYDRNNSLTFKEDGTTFVTHLDTVSVQGIISKDTIKLGGLTVIDQEFGEATRILGSSFRERRVDGIFGLALQETAQGIIFPPLMNMIGDGTLYKSIVSLWFNGTTEDHAGEVILGGSDKERHHGTVSFVPVVKPGKWEVTLQRFAVGDRVYTRRKSAVIASDVAVIVVPLLDSLRIHRKLGMKPDNGRHIINCMSVDKLPDVVLTFGSKNYPLRPRDYIIQRNEECMSLFVGQDIKTPTGPAWLLGTPFLKAYYTVFDIARSRIGFALAK